MESGLMTGSMAMERKSQLMAQSTKESSFKILSMEKVALNS